MTREVFTGIIVSIMAFILTLFGFALGRYGRITYEQAEICLLRTPNNQAATLSCIQTYVKETQ